MYHKQDLKGVPIVVHAIAQSHSHIPHLVNTTLLWVNYIRKDCNTTVTFRVGFNVFKDQITY